jgi:hypothetical protein
VNVRNWFSRYGRYLLATVGALAITILVYKVGARAVLATIVGAGVWLPVILVLDLTWLATESAAVLFLYDKESKKVAFVDWLRALFVHFATFMVVPVGRVSAEVARAGVLSRKVGKTRAAAAATLMQSFTLGANAVVSSICLGAVFLTTAHAATLALMGTNIVVTGALSVALYLIIRHVPLGGVFGKRIKKLATFGPEIDVHVRASKDRHLGAFSLCVLARLVQTCQYALIVFAVVGDVTLPTALIAEGIQLAGRSMGDAIPNQIGVVEGAFALCAGALRLEGFPEKAVAIALLGRVSNLSMAAISGFCLQWFPKKQPVSA